MQRTSFLFPCCYCHISQPFVFHTMDSSSVAAPLGIEEGFWFGGSPSARTPLVEVIMLGPSSPKINSQANKRVNCPVRSNYFSSTFQQTNSIFISQQIRISQILVTRFDRTKRARCLVGSPTLRIINQIQVSPTLRSPRSMTTQNSRNSCGK
jgi:hypothetical protein